MTRPTKNRKTRETKKEYEYAIVDLVKATNSVGHFLNSKQEEIQGPKTISEWTKIIEIALQRLIQDSLYHPVR